MDLSGLLRRRQLVYELYDPLHPEDAAAIAHEMDIFNEEQHVLALSSAHLAWKRARFYFNFSCCNMKNFTPTFVSRLPVDIVVSFQGGVS